jgi:hypothetical protein
MHDKAPKLKAAEMETEGTVDENNAAARGKHSAPTAIKIDPIPFRPSRPLRARNTTARDGPGAIADCQAAR